MRFTTFKNIEKKVKRQSFYASYFTLDKILYVLSFFGNIASVFLASFFFTKLFSEILTDISSPTLILITTIILLIALELLKRNIFHKFSKEILRYKTIFNGETFTLSVFSILIISMSFYASLRGAREFSSKNDIITQNTSAKVDNYKDSMKIIYDTKISKIEDENIRADKRIEIQDALTVSSVSQRDKRRIDREINNIRKDKDKNDIKIKELKTEYEDVITKYEKTHIGKASIEISKNQSNSVIFIILSTIIELLILIGIFFNISYNFISYNTMRDIIMSKGSYKTWLLYSELLDYMYSNNVDSIDKLVELCNFNNINISENQIKDFLKLLENLDIYVHSDFKVKKKEAETKLNEYFKMV